MNASGSSVASSWRQWLTKQATPRLAPNFADPCLLRHALEFHGYGWGARRLSHRSLQIHVMPGVAFPPVGPVGRGSPPSPVLCAAMTTPCPARGASRVAPLPDTAPASRRSWCPHRARGRGEAPRSRPGLWSPGPPLREWCTATGGAPKFPSYPCEDMPRSQTPVVSCALAIPPPGLLPAGACQPSALTAIPLRLSCWPRLYLLRGAITRPASSLTPASSAHCWAGTWSSLLTCWLGVRQGGLEPEGSHPRGNNNQFHRISPTPKVSGLPWREHALVGQTSEIAKLLACTTPQRSTEGSAPRRSN